MNATVSLAGLLSEQGMRDPFAFYAELHGHGPVCALDPARDRYHAVVHGFDAVERVLRDPRFRMLDADYLVRRMGQVWHRRPSLTTLQNSIFFANAPDHPRMRRVFAQVFTPRRVAGLEPAITRLIERRLDRMAELGAGGRAVDFMTEFASPVPSDVIGELLGVPEDDRSWFPPRSQAMAAILEAGPDIWRHLSAADRAARELRDYFTDLIAERAEQPRDDLISAIVELRRADPERISDEEVLANLVGVYNGGFMTTTHMFGNGLVLLLDRPAAREALLADRDVAADYVDEIIRYAPPVHFGVRWTTAPAEIMGVPVPAFSEVLVLMAAANRDPRRYPDPDVFDHARPHAPSMSFSVGPHYCVGAALARLEGVLAFRMLFDRFPGLTVVEPPEPADQLMFRGYRSLMVTVGR